MIDLNKAKIEITNYHVFQRRKAHDLNAVGLRLMKGWKNDDIEQLETEGQMLQRACGDLLQMKNIVVINDEAHHCYRERPDTNEEAELKGDEKSEAKCLTSDNPSHRPPSMRRRPWRSPMNPRPMSNATTPCGRLRRCAMRHNPASGAIVIMLRQLKMHGMAQAVGKLTEQGSPAFEVAIPVLSQLLKAETAEREVRSTAYQLKTPAFQPIVI